ncbi:DgyrCDS250 [Dimorphilus gyrociliatus]|uniref:DgyrCDS250 n=1 Tax=Dimorphilus gyrociliatus TaxID=2664684 RepID=A0A7I8V6S9_9ANNE|nr:DgyrCDS250 [Dimorphilus gyrociliatus]
MNLTVSTLTNAKTTNEEVSHLKTLKETIKNSAKDGCRLQDILEEDINSFVFYLFERRYGWAESDCKNGRNKREEAKYKSFINESLDFLINWLTNQSVSPVILEAFQYGIKEASQKPSVRKHTFSRVMDWLKSHRTEINEENFTLVETLITLGLTDVWSVIRSSVASRLMHLAHYLSIKLIEQLVSTLVKLCSNLETTWQTKEGAVLGINAILRNFQWVGLISPSSGASTLSFDPVMHTEYLLRMGDEEMECMPDFLRNCAYDTLFPLLAHQQLSVRENTVKAISSYLTRTDFTETLACFKNVICQLTANIPSGIHYHNAINVPNFKFMEAQHAEGLLGVCEFLVKQIPPAHLLPHWLRYTSTFCLYLKHPASTVRQATSSIFKFLVAKDSNNPLFGRLVLDSLSSQWNEGDWQWREGCMLSYELVFRFLIKNHLLYTFGLQSPDEPEEKNDKKASQSYSEENLKLAKSVEIHKSQSKSKDDDEDTFNEEDAIRIRYQKKVSRGRTSISTASPACLELSMKCHLKKRKAWGQTKQLTQDKGRDSHNLHRETCEEIDEDEKEETNSMTLWSALNADSNLVRGSDSSASRPNANRLTRRRRSSMPPDPPTMHPEWLTKINLTSFDEIFLVILDQTVQCLADSCWELRRMAAQLLPVVVEALRWYDMNILETVWETRLDSDCSLWCFGSALALKYTLHHAAKLKCLALNPPATWFDILACRRVVLAITSSVESNAKQLCGIMTSILDRSTYDKLSVIALEVLILFYTHFKGAFVEDNDDPLIQAIDCLKSIADQAYSESAKQKYHIFTVQEKESFFSFSTTQRQSISISMKPALSAIEFTFEELQNCIIPFVKRASDTLTVCSLAPYLAMTLSSFHDQDVLCKILVDSLTHLVTRCGDYLKEKKDEVCKNELLHTAKCLSNLVLKKSLDVYTLRHCLQVGYLICLSVPSAMAITLRAAIARYNNSDSIRSSPLVSPRSNGVDLSLHSIDVRPELIENPSSSDDDESKTKIIKESQTLDASNGSKSSRLRVYSEEEEESDWDDWSEDENEEDDAVREVLAEFVQMFSSEDCRKEIKKLQDDEQKIIKELQGLKIPAHKSWLHRPEFE